MNRLNITGNGERFVRFGFSGGPASLCNRAPSPNK
jgi:hypothetical protein